MVKAFMKTLEVMLVVIFTVMFLIILSPPQSRSSVPELEPVLLHLQKDQGFREFAIQNTECFISGLGAEQHIRKYLHNRYDYVFCSGASETNLPDRRIFLDTLVIAGNITYIEPKVLKLYFWIR